VFFQRGFPNFLQALLCGIVALVLFIGVFNSQDDPLGWRITEPVASFVLVCLGVRCWRLAIVAGPDHLVVRNYFRTVRISWQNIAGFEPPPPYATLGKSGLKIRLTDGRVIAATAGGRTQYDTGRVQAALMRELEELRRRRTGDRTPGGQQPPATPSTPSTP
jgi:hypothetical protein